MTLISLTWVPLALLAIISNVHAGPAGENFFKDFAAYMMLVLGFPLFVIAERIVGIHTERAAVNIFSTGVIRDQAALDLTAFHQEIRVLRESVISDVICLFLGYALSLATILPMLFDVQPTWHARVPLGGLKESLTVAGWWEMLVALPVLNYWWLRWIWKILLWCFYLFRLSRTHLTLIASHPDRTGGLGFLSDAQTKFGWVILAYGITNVASVVGYKIGVEGASFILPSVWGPLVGFIIGAPLLFTTPLLMFTKQLYQAKWRAIEQYHEKATERAKIFEEKWLYACNTGKFYVMGGSELLGMKNLSEVYDHINKMRVVPFDFRSFMELMGQTLGSLLPLLPYLGLPEPLLQILESLFKMTRH